jgi:putative endonuclease
MREKTAYVYIMASKKKGTLYTGVTSNLEKRVWEHKNNIVKSFTQKYNVHNLVYFEFGENILSAIEREKQIKSGSRKKKIELIEKDNPEWNDLSKNF